MKCKNCGTDIDNEEVFCDNCKKTLNNISSRREVNELERLIEQQKSFNDLEDTKELVSLNVLVNEELKKDESIAEGDTKILDIKKDEEFKKEEQPIDNKKKQKKNKKKLIIIISIIVLTFVTIGTILYFTLNNKNAKEEIVVIDYKEVIKNYGDSLKKILSNYLDENEEVPTWQEISKLIEYDKYEVSCGTHNLYKDGNVYLDSCKVNDKKVKYSYGKIQEEEVVVGKSIDIYKNDSNYYSNSSENATLVGTINCKTEDCKYIRAYEKYVLIYEDGYYLYNYSNNSIEVGPFNMEDEYSVDNHIVSLESKLYALYYKKDGSNYLYNVNTGKTLSNIKGTLSTGGVGYSPSIMAKYNYVIFDTNDAHNFVNLKTGNISYSIEEAYIVSIIDDTKNNIAYIEASNSNNQSFKVYNSNGKLLFGGKDIKLFKVRENATLVISEDLKTYKIYDSNLKLKLTSKSYEKIMMLGSDFEVVIKDNTLTLLDANDKELTNFITWDDNKYTLHSMLSGWYTENGKNGIYLVVENKEIPYGTMGSGIEYYYIPTTKETGSIETKGIGGYAKPVLYLYPEKTTNVTVSFSNPSLLTTTYPKFKNRWNVTASPNGDLYDSEGNYYYGLYWEESGSTDVDFSEGFYVTKENAIEFLEEKLTTIGLNPRERNEFIMYWLPILEKNGKSLVYFELTSERDLYNKLIINPRPDSILRVAIHIKKVNKKTSIKEEKLTTFNRTGFTAVEWGGVIH